MKRREFLKKAGITAGTAAAVTTITAPNIIAKPKYRWKMVSTWPPKFPLFQTGAERFARRVKEMSEGRMQFSVMAGGELIPPLGTFDAVSKGTVEAGTGAAYYWAGKTIAAQWFTAVPFGMNAQGMNAWYYAGDGMKLYEETYAPFNLVGRPYGNTGVQMGGWYNKKINSLRDYKGLKMRIPGLAGKVLSKVGGTPVLLPAGEIFTSLERGVIDATEWVGPMHDLRLGLHKAAKYYYAPGWHEPGTVLEVIFNKQKYEKLPKDLQRVLDTAAAENNVWMLSEFEAQNGAALEQLITKFKVRTMEFPADVLKKLRKIAMEVREEEANKDKQALKVHRAFNKFQQKIGAWGAISEKSYQNVIAQNISK